MSMIYRRIVVKVGSSTLTHESGKPNLYRLEQIVRTLCDAQNAGCQVILVTSGAVAMGASRLSLKERPRETRAKQAAAAVGQSGLMALYDRLFGQYGHISAQMLMTRDVVEDERRRTNCLGVLEALLEMGVIPVVNENDTVSVEELEAMVTFGDNDHLSAIVAGMADADALIFLSDRDCLYASDPRTDENAQLVRRVEDITPELRSAAGGPGNAGTGGMASKLDAAEYATARGIDCFIVNGGAPSAVLDVLDGKKPGTHFVAKRDVDR